MRARRLSGEIKADPSLRPTSVVDPDDAVVVPCESVPEHGLGLNVVGMEIKTDVGRGVVRFVGYHPQSRTPRLGIELDSPMGMNGGTVQGYRYFDCARDRGALLKLSQVDLKSMRPRVTGKRPKHTVTLVRPEDGKMGLKFVGPKTEDDLERKPGNYIRSVTPGSAASAAADVLTEGARLIRINGKCVCIYCFP